MQDKSHPAITMHSLVMDGVLLPYPTHKLSRKVQFFSDENFQEIFFPPILKKQETCQYNLCLRKHRRYWQVKL